MKKPMKSLVVYFILILVVGAPVFSSDEGFIVSAVGEAWIESDGSTNRGEAGMVVFAGDVISTGRDGRVVIVTSNDVSYTLEENSSYVFGQEEQKSGFGGLIAGLWDIVTAKFEDTEYSTAAAGTVGAVRGNDAGTELENDELGFTEIEELDEMLIAIDLTVEGVAKVIMTTAILEDYGQIAMAEEMYLEALEEYPAETMLYEMLIDMYMNYEMYDRAAEVKETLDHFISGP